MSGKGWKVGGFLGVTAIAIVWELIGSFDTDPDTMPWTDLITQYIPGEVTAAALGALIFWLPVHFGIRYYRKSKGQKPD